MMLKARYDAQAARENVRQTHAKLDLFDKIWRIPATKTSGILNSPSIIEVAPDHKLCVKALEVRGFMDLR